MEAPGHYHIMPTSAFTFHLPFVSLRNLASWNLEISDRSTHGRFELKPEAEALLL